MEITFGEYFPYQHHQARLPAGLQPDRLEAKRHKVVIAGGGPCGLALALGLANHGIPVTVLEADATVCTGSRAGAFTRRTLEILEQLSVIDAVLPSGLTWSVGRTYLGDREVFSFTMPDDANQKYPPALSHLQNFIEQCMVERAEAMPDLIDIRWQSQVANLESFAGGAHVEVQTPADSYELDTDWLVACDGGRSTVRQLLGLSMQGKRHEGRYLIIDIRIDTTGLPAGRRCWFDPPSKPGGTLLLYKKPNGMLRFDYQLNEDEDEDEACKPEVVFRQIDTHLRMLGIDRPWEPVWMSLYRASALTLESYRHGRVLFAGDAAHLVPIFGVRGMNSSVEDAHNLAWKLAYVIKGTAADHLLDSYSTERVYAARENHRYASKSAEFMAPPSKSFRLMRDAVLSLAERHPQFASLINPRQHAAIPLIHSPLNVPDAEDLPFTAGPAPGEILRECPLEWRGATGHLTDLIGAHFTALCFSEQGDLPIELTQALAHAAAYAPLVARVIACAPPTGTDIAYDHTSRLFPLYGAQAGSVYLVRPDGHVLARWLRAAPDQLLPALLGSLS
jgi:3-(3-hydroxy-phenyl)propionate hydroxylase